MSTTLFERFKTWLARQLIAPENVATSSYIRPATGQNDTQIDPEATQHLVPFDENLLERSRTQWQFGDWASLAAISRDTLQHHPDRAKLALLVATGNQGLGNAAEARQYTRLALDWGCSKKLVSQILISGVHNTLGRMAAVSGQEQRALQHFQSSIQMGAPHSDVRLLSQARIGQQLSQLGLSAPTLEVASVLDATRPFGGRLNLPDITPLTSPSTN